MTQGTRLLDGPVERQILASSARSGPVESLLGGNGTLHHLGFAVPSISETAEEFALTMSANWDGEIIHDPLQRVRVAFFSPIDTRNPVFELVEPDSEASPVTNFLKKRVGLHHVCYEVDDLELPLHAAQSLGLVRVSDPKPAVAFGGRKIAWVCSRRFLLIELLERHG
jgi:methylmalonyl-CoA/ethylmalonyl-CoA epimerase